VAIREAPLRATKYGLVPEGEGWFALNARETRWRDYGPLGIACNFEGKRRFSQLGVNLNVLEPGQPMTQYHRERAQEAFLVLAGDCLLVVEGEERRLRPWDFFHCPGGTAHAIVGAGKGTSVVLAVGARGGRKGFVYPVEPAALKHGAGVQREATTAAEAYSRFPRSARRAYREGWLPDLGAGASGKKKGRRRAEDGWFVANVRDLPWVSSGYFSDACVFEDDDTSFADLGFTLGVLLPGQPSGLYHREANQEDFLVLAGECLAIVEDEERSLRAWDFVHCPAGTDHILVGAGEGPCLVFMTGARKGWPEKGIFYPRSEVALRYGAGVEEETSSPAEAYSPFPRWQPAPPVLSGMPWA